MEMFYILWIMWFGTTLEECLTVEILLEFLLSLRFWIVCTKPWTETSSGSAGMKESRDDTKEGSFGKSCWG